MKKRVLALLLGVVMSFALAACGSGGDDASKPAQGESKTGGKEPSIEVVSEALQKYTTLDAPCATYLAELKNTGEVPVKISNISIDVEDAAGSILKSADFITAYPNVINPGESAYICEEVVNGAFDEGVALDNIGKAILHYDIEKQAAPESLPVAISEIALGESYGYPNLVGRIENTGSTDIEELYIVADIRSADGTLQNVIFTIVDNLKAGEKKGFEQMAIAGDLALDFSASTVNVKAYIPVI